MPPSVPAVSISPPLDALARPLRDLRISVTDRCNFRCPYCMPAEIFDTNYRFVARSDLLDFAEIERLVRVFVRLGVSKLRITGGEPLLRRGLPVLIKQLSKLPGITDIALTTNGVLLPAYAEELARAGLQRVTVSLDTLDPAQFRQLSGRDQPLSTVLAGIEAARAAGLHPLKINAVIQRDVNLDAIIPLADFAREQQVAVRYIEYMDVGTCNGWQPQQVVSGREIRHIVQQRYPLQPLSATYRGEVARRYGFVDGSAGEIGFITSISEPFCGTCSRARLSCEGKWYTCLFASDGLDLRGPLRAGLTEDALCVLLQQHWQQRRDRYSEERAEHAGQRQKVEMYAIGG